VVCVCVFYVGLYYNLYRSAEFGRECGIQSFSILLNDQCVLLGLVATFLQRDERTKNQIPAGRCAYI